jgi:hypothetical protein
MTGRLISDALPFWMPYTDGLSPQAEGFGAVQYSLLAIEREDLETDGRA